MRLSPKLKEAVARLVNSIPPSSLMRASTELSQRYRSLQNGCPFISSDLHRFAYLAVRMPATYAAIHRVLQEVLKRMPQLSPSSIIDLGSGPGTASWAALDLFETIEKITFYEKDPEWTKLSTNLMLEIDPSVTCFWNSFDLTKDNEYTESDLSIMAYLIGEMTPEATILLLDKVWKVTQQVLLIIEPGTPHGFERIRKARDFLISKGAHLVAPCPHHRSCPIPQGDWCHFSERLERSSLHRFVKEAELGFEDEKFSYVAFAKQPQMLPEARILRHPQHHSGHTEFVLCHAEGSIVRKTISRKQGEIYKKAKKLEWGDTFL